MNCDRCQLVLTKDNAKGLDDDGNPTEPACKQCWDTYLIAYQHHEDWEAMCDRFHRSAEDNSEFDEAVRIGQKIVKAPWFPTEVVQGSGIELEVVRSIIGIPRADFIQMFGEAPEAKKVPLTDVPDENEKIHKAVLVRNPSRPFMEFNLKYKTALDKREYKLDPERHVLARQPGEIYQFVKAEQETEHKYLNKMKACSLTYSELQAKMGVQPARAASSSPFGLSASDLLNTAPAGDQSNPGSEQEGLRSDGRIKVRPADGPVLRAASPPPRWLSRGKSSRHLGGNGADDVSPSRGSQAPSMMTKSEVVGRGVRSRGRAAGVAERSPGQEVEAFGNKRDLEAKCLFLICADSFLHG